MGTNSGFRERQSSSSRWSCLPITEMNWSMMPHGMPA